MSAPILSLGHHLLWNLSLKKPPVLKSRREGWVRCGISPVLCQHGKLQVGIIQYWLSRNDNLLDAVYELVKENALKRRLM